MAVLPRRTAVLEIRSPTQASELLPLDVQRPYSFVLAIDGRQVAGGVFESPLGDEAWRNVVSAMREATAGGASEPDAYRRQTETVKDAGRRLFRSLSDLAPELGTFLVAEDEPRRLVILSGRPEIHLLPWESMVDAQWRSIADTDLSIIHALATFDEHAVGPAVPVAVHAVFGPGTEKRTLRAVRDLAEDAAERGGGRVAVRGIDGAAPAMPAPEVQIVHVEAHGDERTGVLDLESPDPFATSLADSLKDRAMVLLWSCFSALVHSWGESLCLKLHKQGNTFVLGFATPLRFDTSADLASRFYAAVFGVHSVVDAETAVVRERSRLYREKVRACEWAALTLWLRSPVDLGEAVFQGPRLLGAAEQRLELPDTERRLLETALKEALPGRMVLVTRFALRGGLPEGLFKDVRGAVVHLRAGAENEGAEAALGWLGARSRSVHRGDRLLALLEAFEKLPGSLLVWSGVSVREAQALTLHGALPASLAILLTSPWKLPAGLASAHVDGGQEHPATKPPGWVDEISDVEELVETGRNQEATKRAAELELHGGFTRDQQGRLLSAFYWGLARLGEYDRSEEMLARVSAVDGFTALLLQGNMLRRKGRYLEARAALDVALGQATTASDRATVQIELAGGAAETGDRSLADRLYREAITGLEGVTGEIADRQWHSALGRALRDLAALHAEDAAGCAECEALLRRAVVIHGIDGRFGNVAATLKTRGVLERTRGRWDLAEESLAAAANIYEWCSNLVAWALVIEEIADLAYRMAEYPRALVLIERARRRVRGTSTPAVTVLGRLALLEAQVQWRLGNLEEVRGASKEALRVLPADRARERAAAGQILGLVESLLRIEARPQTVDRPGMTRRAGKNPGAADKGSEVGDGARHIRVRRFSK